MKVKISKYTTYYGPYQIAEMFTPIFGEERIERFTDSKLFDKISDWIEPVTTWIDSKKVRKVDIRIDKYDTWSMDNTLALIILPMLIQLKETKHGSPMVDDEDVPDKLKSTSAKPKENDYEADSNLHARWDYVMDEMIWAFKQENVDDWEAQFHTGKRDVIWKDLPPNEDGEVLSEMIRGPNDTSHWDQEGHIAHTKRMQNGFRLFGKYYSGLWD